MAGITLSTVAMAGYMSSGGVNTLLTGDGARPSGSVSVSFCSKVPSSVRGKLSMGLLLLELKFDDDQDREEDRDDEATVNGDVDLDEEADLS